MRSLVGSEGGVISISGCPIARCVVVRSKASAPYPLLYDSCPNTTDHSFQEGQISTVVAYHRYMQMGGELEDNIEVIGGE